MERIREIGAIIAELIVGYPLVLLVLLPGFIVSLVVFWLLYKGWEWLVKLVGG